MKKIFLAVYSSLEYYPPSLNALTCLLPHFDKVDILSRHVNKLAWDYDPKVTYTLSGDFVPIRQAEQKSMLWKVWSFLQFTWAMLQIIRKEKPQVVVLYDPFPTLAYSLIRPLLTHKHLLHYHNHDVLEQKYLPRYNLAAWAARAEQNLFDKIDIFSLPSEERKQYFPMDKFKGKYFYVPNVPARSFYGKFYQSNKATKPIKLIFQGTIAKGHGLEQIISQLLPKKINGKPVELHLRGLLNEEYKNSLLNLATQQGLNAQLIFHGFGAYQDVPKIASQCHIGIAVHTGTDVMNKTLGTSSNKIYEYAAVGLPILLYDNSHFRQHLGKYEWAFFTDLSEQSLVACIEKIMANYETLSAQAHKDFVEHLNFEKYFEPLLAVYSQELRM